MAWSDDDYIVAFDAEAGDVASLAVAASKIQWFNEGQEALLRRKPTFDDVSWAAADRSVALPSDFIQIDKLIFDTAVAVQDWRVYGKTLVTDDPDGVSAAGSARVYYWSEWPLMTTSVASELTRSQDYACMYFALSRFYKRLSSNRAFYKRYSTLVGQNAVSMTDLQQEADRYYQDFLERRDDLEPEAPAFYYPSG